MKRILVSILCLTPLCTAYAAKEAVDGRVDPRIKTVIYNSRDVVVIYGHYGYSTHIVFAEDEVVEHLSPGDSLAWQIVPKKNHLFLKPVENNADTNLSVLTNKRQYNFELRADEASGPADRSLSFLIQFHYPEDEMRAALTAASAAKQQRDAEVMPDRGVNADALNFDYAMRGSEDIAPTRVFDDGEFTFFQFPPEVDTPAIFLIDRDKNEAIINYHVRGKYVVVQRIGRQFILRSGNAATCIYNEAYQNRREPSELPTISKAEAEAVLNE